MNGRGRRGDFGLSKDRPGSFGLHRGGKRHGNFGMDRGGDLRVDFWPERGSPWQFWPKPNLRPDRFCTDQRSGTRSVLHRPTFRNKIRFAPPKPRNKARFAPPSDPEQGPACTAQAPEQCPYILPPPLWNKASPGTRCFLHHPAFRNKIHYAPPKRRNKAHVAPTSIPKRDWLRNNIHFSAPNSREQNPFCTAQTPEQDPVPGSVLVCSGKGSQNKICSGIRSGPLFPLFRGPFPEQNLFWDLFRNPWVCSGRGGPEGNALQR